MTVVTVVTVVTVLTIVTVVTVVISISLLLNAMDIHECIFVVTYVFKHILQIMHISTVFPVEASTQIKLSHLVEAVFSAPSNIFQ